MNNTGRVVNSGGLLLFLVVLSVLSVVDIASLGMAGGPAPDRAEREPGDRDRSNDFGDLRRYPAMRQEVEPGDAASQGDFTQTDPLDREVEPLDQEGDRSPDRRAPNQKRRVQNAIRRNLP
ncbi:MAG: hypothetical protein H7838_06280 [Magnetococcus sp. DMHC-8]